MTRQGLKVLPYLLPHSKQPRGILDCERCMPATPAGQRAKMHCGWMPRSTWPATVVGVPFNKTEGCTVCPGWLTRQPAVLDGAEAYSARQAGALIQYDPDGLNNVWEASSVLEQAVNKWTAELSRSAPVPHG